MSDAGRTDVPGVEEHPSLALVDSIDDPGERGDALTTPAALRDWLLARDLIDPETELHQYCRGRILALRETLRHLFAAHARGEAPAADDVEALNRALTSAPGVLLLHFESAAGFTRRAEHPVTQVVEHLMARIAEDAAALLTGDDAALLAACQAAGCPRFFIRRHARRQWCSSRCGDRVRAARAYARRRAAAPVG